jgi:hypothetical protein
MLSFFACQIKKKTNTIDCKTIDKKVLAKDGKLKKKLYH